MSTGITITPPSGGEVEHELGKLGMPIPLAKLLDMIGMMVEGQTQFRITDEKSAPNGEPWPEWSAAYARTRHGNQSLLRSHGDLLNDLTHYVQGGTNEVDIGSRLVYAATHQYGDTGRNIPQRQFLGLSDDNESDLLEMVNDYIGKHLVGNHR